MSVFFLPLTSDSSSSSSTADQPRPKPHPPAAASGTSATSRAAATGSEAAGRSGGAGEARKIPKWFKVGESVVCSRSLHTVCVIHDQEWVCAGFCPHWLGVVGSNHHSAIFTTTQAYFATTHRV